MSQDRFKNITIQQMDALVRVIEMRSFSRAAKGMNVTQPALTKHIKNLEDAVGFRVADRGYAGITLTREGRLLYDYARRILKLRDEAREKIMNSRLNEDGNIYISASTIPATYILPCVLSGFRRSAPGIKAYIRVGDSEEVIEMILDGRAEMGFIGKNPSSAKLIAEPIWKDTLILAVPAGHRWPGRISLRELEDEPFVIREKGSGSRETLEKYLKGRKDSGLSRMNIVGELGSSEAVKEAVISGLGVSIISIHAVRRELEQGILRQVEIKGFRIERNFHLIYKKQFDLMPYHKLFLKYLNEHNHAGGSKE
jgi:DNA-binding transcriptional LysR family regulator